MPSFDIVSKVDMQEVQNGLQHALKELAQRYDFKGSKATVTLENEELKISAENDYKLEAVKDILMTKLNKRGISPKSLDMGKIETATGGTVRQTCKIIQGLASDKAKEVNKYIKELKLKVNAEIQKEQLRITGKKRDDLQEVIAALRDKDFGPPLQFINFRD
jgi:cyclic-di-GMP-binding protein